MSSSEDEGSDRKCRRKIVKSKRDRDLDLILDKNRHSIVIDRHEKDRSSKRDSSSFEDQVSDSEEGSDIGSVRSQASKLSVVDENQDRVESRKDKGRKGKVSRDRQQIGTSGEKIDVLDLLDFRKAKSECLDYIPYKEGVDRLLAKTVPGEKSGFKLGRDREQSPESDEESDRRVRSEKSSEESSGAARFPSRSKSSSSRWGNWIKYEKPYKVIGDGSGGYALLNRDKGNIVSLSRVHFAQDR